MVVAEDDGAHSKTGGRSLGPRRDPDGVAFEQRRDKARVVGETWASADPGPFERFAKLGSPVKRDGGDRTGQAYHDPWGVNLESVGAIQLGAGKYFHLPHSAD